MKFGLGKSVGSIEMDSKNSSFFLGGVTMRCFYLMFVFCVIAIVAIQGSARAAVLVEYDATSNILPDASSPAWAYNSTAPLGMEMSIQTDPNDPNIKFLEQDWTSDDPTVSYENFVSPSAGTDIMVLGSGQYGIEFRVRPRTDVPAIGYSLSANLQLSWSDDTYYYNMTADKYLQDDPNDPNGLGGSVMCGKDDAIPVTEGIDWSVPHTIFVGYDGGENPYGAFNIYVDGVWVNQLNAETIGRDHVPQWQNKVCFGDTTAPPGGLPDVPPEIYRDEAAEWYFIRIHDVGVLDGMGCGDSSHAYPVGDLNRDCVVDLEDYAIMAGSWATDTRPQ